MVARSATVQRRQFANPDVQRDAKAKNKSIPLRPTSDVKAALTYTGEERTVPVGIATSFKLDREVRRAMVRAKNEQGGEELLFVDFDVTEQLEDGISRRVDVLTRGDGSVVTKWQGDKAHEQLASFFGESRTPYPTNPATDLTGEARMQAILRNIAAASKAA